MMRFVFVNQVRLGWIWRELSKLGELLFGIEITQQCVQNVNVLCKIGNGVLGSFCLAGVNAARFQVIYVKSADF